MGWRYIATRITGPNAGEVLDWNLPLENVELTRALGCDWLSADVSSNNLAFRDRGTRSLFTKWNTAIWAERNGRIWCGGILVGNNYAGGNRKLEVMGYGGYPQGLVFMDEYKGVQVDPLDVVRMLWNDVQSYKYGDLGMVLDNTTSPVRIGEKEVEVKKTTTTKAGSTTPKAEIEQSDGPYVIAWYEASDVGETISKLAEETPFETREDHYWAGDDTNTIRHRLRIGYPRLGKRRDDLRFATGENIFDPPDIEDDGMDYANDILSLGAGEGRKIVRSRYFDFEGDRLRRTYVYTNKSVKTREGLRRRAIRLMPHLKGEPEISEIVVRNHPNAPLGSWDVGDDILVQISTDWIDISKYYRITQEITKPADPDIVTLKLEPL